MMPFDLYASIRKAGGIRPFYRYLLVTLIFLVVAAIRLGVDPALTAPFLFLLSPIFLCAALFGLGAGIYASALGCLIAIRLLNPSGVFSLEGWDEALALATFALAGAALSWIGAMLRTSVVKLGQAERENDLLLRELNHRISNDLSRIVSLLTVQALSASDKATREALQRAASQVAVIGSVHSQLRLAKGAQAVELGDYLGRLCEGLRIGAVGDRPIRLSVSVEPALVPVRTASALGLIVNELVTNALKYAFPDGGPGRIEIRFRHMPDGAEFQVGDDGVGMPAPELELDRGGLGQLLVRQLVEELGGTVTIENRGGTVVRIALPRSSVVTGAEADPCRPEPAGRVGEGEPV